MKNLKEPFGNRTRVLPACILCISRINELRYLTYLLSRSMITKVQLKKLSKHEQFVLTSYLASWFKLMTFPNLGRNTIYAT